VRIVLDARAGAEDDIFHDVNVSAAMSDALTDLVALVERETAKLSNRDAWPAILALAEVRGVTGKSKGEFRKLVWQARSAAIEAKRAERAAKRGAAREQSFAKLVRRIEMRKTRPNKLRRVMPSTIVVER
jgi:hypothetical protein